MMGGTSCINLVLLMCTVNCSAVSRVKIEVSSFQARALLQSASVPRVSSIRGLFHLADQDLLESRPLSQPSRFHSLWSGHFHSFVWFKQLSLFLAVRTLRSFSIVIREALRRDVENSCKPKATGRNKRVKVKQLLRRLQVCWYRPRILLSSWRTQCLLRTGRRRSTIAWTA